jgi:hypothetical protein
MQKLLGRHQFLLYDFVQETEGEANLSQQLRSKFPMYKAYLQKAYDNLLPICCLLTIQEHVSITFVAIQRKQLKRCHKIPYK